MKKCDVIVPIYNAYESVNDCIKSLLENTNFENNRLILINDCSTDERIIPLLKKYSEENEFIVFLNNKENLGFVKTVNIGMKYSNNDVLLLNSDTEVPKGWLEKISKCAYSEKMVATVTPLSNNATLVSVPIGLQRNELPEKFTLNEYQELIEKSSYKEYPELPTAHGFCMYIKREIIEKIGYFDEESFGKGYGEENDFSFRCIDYEYKNLLCDDVIVYHKEKQSFGNQKREEVMEKHQLVLKERYQNYTNYIGHWCHIFPIKKSCDVIKYAVELSNRKNVLFLIHDWSNLESNVGGTTLHALDLIKELREKYNFHVLFPSNGYYKLHSYFKSSESTIILEENNNINALPTYNKKYKQMIEKLVSAFSIDAIHIHHMIGHNFDIIDVAKEKNITSIITIHDLYPICPTINMLYKMESYCVDLKTKDCKECLKCKLNISNNIIPEWRNLWKKFLNEFDYVITPSNDTKKIINSFYKNIKITPIEHGVNIKKQNYEISNNEEFNVAFIGVMAVHKGAFILEKLINNCKNEKIKFHLFGISELESLNNSKERFTNHGKYKREDLPNLLKENNINLVCMMSIWPETYSYTLTETIACGIPVLALDIGAIGERVKKYNFGWTLPVDSKFEKIKDKIIKISNNKKEYLNVINNIQNYEIKTTKLMAKEYIKFYNQEQKEINFEELKKIISNSIMFEKRNFNYNNEELEIIKNSLKWRIVSKIKVPSSIKKVVKKIIK